MNTAPPLVAVWVVLVAAGLTIGCGSSAEQSGSADMDDLVIQMEEAGAAAAPEQPAPSGGQPKQAGELEVVTAKSPKRGKSLEGGGYLSTVTGTRFWAEHQIILNNIKHALQLYNATHGHYPKTHDEFMDQIIKANDIRLPELEPGYVYVYDPDDPLTLKMQRQE